MNSRCANAESSIAAMLATTMRSNITPMRDSMKLLVLAADDALIGELGSTSEEYGRPCRSGS